MTALDRAFIKAYTPQDAMASHAVAAVMPPLAESVLPADAVEHHAATVTPAPHAAANRSSVLAALEQPFRPTIGALASAVSCPTVAPAAASVAARVAAPVAAPPAAARPPAASPVARPAILPVTVLPAPDQSTSAATAGFEAASDCGSESPAVAMPTLSAFLKLRDAAAAPAMDEAADDAVVEPAAIASQSADEPTACKDASEAVVYPWAVPETLGHDGLELSAASLRIDAGAAAAAAEVEPVYALAGEAETASPTTATPTLALFDKGPESDDVAANSPFQPAQRVEQFTWPRACRRLIARAAEELDQLADALLAANKTRQNVLAVGGWHRGEGATTLLLCAARRLAERGVKSVLVDADMGRPRLAKRLGVQAQVGWNQLAAGAEAMMLDQVIVEATVNNIALAPVCEPAADDEPFTADRSRLPDCLDALRQHYDMVLVDLGPLELADVRRGRSGEGPFHGIDALVLVRDQRLTSPEKLGEIAEQLKVAGVTIAGVIENFVDA